MADDYNALLGFQGQEDADRLYQRILAEVTGQPAPQTTPPVQTQFTPTPAPSPAPGTQEQPPPPRGFSALGQYIYEGAQRNLAQLNAVVPSLQAQYHALAGDPVAEILAASEAQHREDQAPQARWRLQDITSPEEFSYWLAERFGENALTLLTSFAGGGGGMLAGSMLSRAMGGSAAFRAAAQRYGMLGGGFASATALEIPATGSEQFQVTGSVQPHLAIPAGVLKGMLEMWVPNRVMTALSKPGRQFGQSVIGGIGKGFLEEGATETLQEGIDIALRMRNDPNYSFFGTGPNIMGEGAWRLAEAGLAGGLIGGGLGGITGHIEGRQERRRLAGPNESGLLPGQERTVQEGTPPSPSPPPSPVPVPVQGELPLESPQPGMPTREIVRAGHASPHLFDQVDLTKVGTGEGAQSFGHGFYSAESPNVIKAYQAKFSKADKVKIDGEEMSPPADARVTMEQLLRNRMQARGLTDEQVISGSIASIETALQASDISPKSRGLLEESLRWLQGIQGKQIEFPNIAHIYEVEHNFEPEQLLDWDRPLSEQSPAVRALTTREDFGFPPPTITGAALISRLRDPAVGEAPSPKAISDALLAAGIPGIRYKDAFSRRLGGTEGTYNYVSFDQNATKVLTRNGQPITASPETREMIHRASVRVQSKSAPQVPADEGSAGPVTVLQRIVEDGPTLDRGPVESTIPLPQEDMFDVTPMLRSSGLQDQEIEHYLNWLEARTPRYVVEYADGGVTSQIMNSADYELHSAETAPQSQQLRTWEVDQQSIIPALVTANLLDLPEMTSRRIWFLPGTDKSVQTSLLLELSRLKSTIDSSRYQMLLGPGVHESNFLPIYDALLKQGLRVIPTRGSSFYYGSGPIRAKEVVVSKSSRSLQWTFLDQKSGTLVSPGIVDGGQVTRYHSMQPVAINLDSFKPGEVSVLPERTGSGELPNYSFEGVEEKDRAKIYNEVDDIVPTGIAPVWTEKRVEAFRALMRRGIYISPKTVWQVNGLITKEAIRPEQMVPGVNLTIPGFALSELQLKTVPVITTGNQPVMKVSLDSALIGHRTAEKIEQIVRELLPTFENLLRRLGYDRFPTVSVATPSRANWRSDSSFALYKSVDDSVTFLVEPGPSAWDQYRSEVELGKAVFDTLAHELGHAITVRQYSKLPVELKQQVDYAFNKALLASRTGDTVAGVLRMVPDVAAGNNVQYYSTKVEWLAEQFRRYVTSDREVRSELDRALKEVGEEVERYYRVIEEIEGELTRKNLEQPDYFFSAWMQYEREYGRVKEQLRQMERQQALYTTEEGLYETRPLTMVVNEVMKVFASMRHMMPANHPFHLLFANQLDPRLGNASPGALGRIVRGVRHQNEVKAIMEIAVGSLPAGDPQLYREVFAHELIHAYYYLGIISKEEMNVLYTAAVRDGQGLSQAQKSELKRSVAKRGAQQNWDLVQQEAIYQDLLREETVAYYVGNYARTGKTRPEAKSLLDRILDVLRRIGNAMRGMNYQKRDEILEAFFRGEMVSRAERAQREAEMTQRFMKVMFDPLAIRVDERKQVDERYDAQIEYERNRRGEVDFVTYQYVDRQTGEVVGQQEINVVPGKGFNVHMQFSERPGMALKWAEFVQKELGLPLLGPKMFTLSGFRAATRVFPILKDYYIRAKDPRGGDDHYFSPKYLKEQYEISKRIVEGMKRYKQDGNTLGRGQMTLAERRMRWYKQQLDKVPKDLWTENAHYLNQLFMLPRNWHRDEVQGSMVRNGVAAEEAKLEGVLGRPPEASTMRDNMEAVNEQALRVSRQTAAAKAGIDFEQVAAAQPMSREIRRVLHWLDTTGKTNAPGVARQLRQMGAHTALSQEADRIGHFSKVYWNLRQLIWRNEHLTGLQVYGQRVEQFAAVISAWHRDADDIARIWEQRVRNPKDREQFNGLMYWLAEMKYRTPQEVQNDVVRHPTQQELMSEIARRNLNLPGIVSNAEGILWRLYQPPWRVGMHMQDSIFARFLDSIEAVGITNITNQISDPTLRAQAIAELQKELNELRAKPYFPVSRFGQHSITVRDADPLHNNRVLHFSTYESHITRDANVDAISAQYPLDHITVGRVPEEFLEFLGLPGPLIAEVRRNLPNITPTQIAWLEQLERQNVPDKAFRARFRPRTGTPGYSMDAFRSFAHYFMHGSRYLARMQFRDSMLQAISSVEASIPGLGNSSKRQMIVDYMRKHYNYVMEGGRDYAKFKALIAIMQLGFSPAAAAMNFTQTPFVSLPWLQGVFGTGQGTAQILRSIRAARGLRSGIITSTVGDYRRAHAEAQRQGRIDIGQAAELGAFAEGNNLLGLLAGTKAQKAYRNFSWASMWMFQRVEQVNREILFHAVWEQGHKQFATNKRIGEIQQHYFTEISELQARTGMTYQDATVFVLAKEALDQTQGLYAPYARPTFMRKPLAATLLIFYQFTQMMTYAFFYNPGQVQLWLIMVAMYGIAGGVPGAEDAAEFLQFLTVLANKLFGTGTFDLMTEARRLARAVTRGTIFDEVGPDLFIHGLSRYGFGLNLLPSAGALAPFDASANGSLGKLVPGLYEALHAPNTSASFDRFVADVAQRTAGAGIGWFFNLAQFFMNSPGSVDSHKWEQALPRVLRAVAAGFRYTPAELNPGQPQTLLGLPASVGAATTPSGAAIARFNPTDPEDMAALAWQFLGFRPNKVSQAQDLRRMRVETEQIFLARRSTLMAQYSAALLSGQNSEIDAMNRAVTRYNAEVAAAGDPTLGISNEQLRQSARNRAQQRLLDEQFTSRRRMLRGVDERINDLFPGVKVEQVR